MANLSPLGIALSMQPQSDPASRPNVAPTDVIGAYKLATDAANTQYLGKLQQQNAMWGGLAGLGGAGLLAAPSMYSSGMLSGLFGGGAAAGAADPAAMALGGDVASLLPSTAAAGGADALAGLGADAGAGLAAAAAPAAADAAGFSLADILPFLLAA